MKFPGGSKHWLIAICIISILVLGLLSWRGLYIEETNILESLLYQVLRPFQKFVTDVHHSVNDYWALISNLQEIKEEDESLKKRIGKLENQLARYKNIKQENQRLRKLLAFKELVPFKTIGGKVIGITPNNWVQELIIDRGAKDGIREKMPVITYNGALVGKISKVTANTARISLITDVNFTVGGRIQREESRAIGVVRGRAKEKEYLLMDQIPWDAELQEGDLVVTSGLTNNFPMGVPIGRVIEVKEGNYGLIQQAEVKSFMGLTPIEEVLVITDF